MRGIGLTNNKEDSDIRVALDDLLDSVDVVLVLVGTVLVKGILSVRGSSSAVAIREVVDDELASVVTTSLVSLANVDESVLHQGDVLERVPVDVLSRKFCHANSLKYPITYIH